MANHKSAIKRIRSNNTKKLRNKLQHKKTKTQINESSTKIIADEIERLIVI